MGTWFDTMCPDASDNLCYRLRASTAKKLFSWVLALLALIAPSSTLAVAVSKPTLLPRCGGPFQLCGYVGPSSIAYRIPQRFEVARPFAEGLAAVRIEGRYGYIDTTGKMVIAPRFQAAGAFTSGYAEIRLAGASGIIDRSGQIVVPARFARIIPFHGGTFIATLSQSAGYAGYDSDEQLRGVSDGAGRAFLGWPGGGLYHVGKGWLTGQDLKFELFDRPERGLIWAGANSPGEPLWGLMRSDGSWQVAPQYSYVLPLSETRAVVRSREDWSLALKERREAVRSGAVDRNGKLVVPLKFFWLGSWRGGYGYAKEGVPVFSDKSPEPREGMVKPDGTLLANRYFDKVDISEDGSLPRGRLGKTWFSIEPSGRLIPDQRDGKPLLECPGGLKIIEHGEDVEFLRPSDGRSVGRFDNLYFTRRDCLGSFSVRRNGRWFEVLENGTIVGGERGYENTYGFHGRHTAVQVDGKWGIITRSGAFTVEPRFSSLSPDRNDTYVVGEGVESYWINATGERVERPAFVKPTPSKALTCEGGLRYFQKDGLWGFEDADGKPVIEPRFRALSCFSNGVSWAAATGAHAWCAIGADGRQRDALACKETYYYVWASESHPEELSEDPFESSVLWARAYLDYRAGKRAEPPNFISNHEYVAPRAKSAIHRQ